MFDPSVAALFPLPLGTFERYMLLDDSADHPMIFAVQIRLSGTISRSDFEAALDETLSSHPLLCATMSRTRGRPAWVVADGVRPVIDWNAFGVPVAHPRGARIDLRSEAGLRIWVREGDGTADVLLHFHHASCDGVGALRFLGHWLAAYAAKTSLPGGCPAMPLNDAKSLLRRECFSAPASRLGLVARCRTIWKGMGEGLRWFRQRPAVLAPMVPALRSIAASSPLLAIHRHVLDRRETDRLRQVAAGHGVTLNDLMLRDMFLTLLRWTARHPFARGEGRITTSSWLRIAIPVNLKTGEEDRLSAANGVSYTFITRHSDECGDARKLLQDIHGQTDAATRRRRSMLFLRGFRLLERIPGAIPLYMNAKRCFSTVVLSNLGEITRHLGTVFPEASGKIVVGNLVLEEIFGVPPVRPHTPASFMVGRYAGRLWIGLRGDPLVWTDEQTQELLDDYVEQLRHTAEREAGDTIGLATGRRSDPPFRNA